MNKQVPLETVDLEYETLDKAIQMLFNFKHKYQEFTNLKFEKSRYHYDVTEYLWLMGERPETEVEEQERLKKEQEDNVRKLQYEVAEFERLKKKLGK